MAEPNRQPLRLAHRQPPKPKRHGGLIDSDRIVGAYLDEVERLPKRHTIITKSRVPWLRRWLRRLLQIVR